MKIKRAVKIDSSFNLKSYNCNGLFTYLINKQKSEAQQ